MAEVVSAGPIHGRIDVCTRCQFLWFDKEEWADVEPEPTATANRPQHGAASPPPLPPEAVIELSRIALRQARDRDAADVFASLSQISGASIGRSLPLSATPVTWFLVAVTVLVYAKTAQYDGFLFDMLTLSPTNPWRLMGITFLTAPLIHEGLTSLLVGIVVLILVGRPCEDAVGSTRISAVLVVGAVLGGFLHLISGTERALHGNAHVVSALVGFFSVRFPSARIPYIYPYFGAGPQNRWMLVTVWVLFIGWLLSQSIHALCGWNYVSLPAVWGGATIGAIMAFAARASGDSRPGASVIPE